MGRLIWPAFEAVAQRFSNINGLLDRLGQERAERRREQEAFRARIEARADAWMASAPYRDVERIRHYAETDAYEIVELLVLTALDCEAPASEDLADTVDVFAGRVVETMRAPEFGVRTFAGPPKTGPATELAAAKSITLLM